MNIVPAKIEAQINRVDRQPSLFIGIGAAAVAVWSVYRLFWLLYIAVTWSGFGVVMGSLVFQFVLWGVIGVVAAIAAIGFLTRYAKGPDAHKDDAGTP